MINLIILLSVGKPAVTVPNPVAQITIGVQNQGQADALKIKIEVGDVAGRENEHIPGVKAEYKTRLKETQLASPPIAKRNDNTE